MMATEKPNVLLVLADDVGWFDVGAYHRGIMGAATPNIDRIAAEGVLTDNYAQASCTAGRAAFITDTGPLTRKRMETVEDALLARSLEFMEQAHQAGRPFLLWHNTTACTS